ncbi:MAG TPA: lipoprotein [Xanthobacteraceae bacterium]|nr:lipoprotein [Xanthobacteraceae bacterium]
MPRFLVSLPARYAVAAALVLALGLTGCGRKGALDPPPGGLSEPSVTSAPPGTAAAPPGQAAAPAAPNPQQAAQPAAKKTTPLDWLLN